MLQVKFWTWVPMRQYSHYENRTTEECTEEELQAYLDAHEDERVEANGDTRGQYFFKNEDKEWCLEVTELKDDE